MNFFGSKNSLANGCSAVSTKECADRLEAFLKGPENLFILSVSKANSWCETLDGMFCAKRSASILPIKKQGSSRIRSAVVIPRQSTILFASSYTIPHTTFSYFLSHTISYYLSTLSKTTPPSATWLWPIEEPL